MCNNYMHSVVKRQYSDAVTDNCFIMVLVDKALLCKGRVKCVYVSMDHEYEYCDEKIRWLGKV